MPLLYPFMIISYWASLSGMIFLTGAYITKVFVFAPIDKALCAPADFEENAKKRLLLISLITLAANTLHIILHCSVMTETPLQEVFSILPMFIMKTRYGLFTLYRTLFLSVILLVALYSLKREDRTANITGVISSLLSVITLAMSGHQGTKGYISMPFLFDSVHLLAVSLWIGGIFFLKVCYHSLLSSDDILRNDRYLMLINHFSRLATLAVLAVGLTGLGISLDRLSGVQRWFSESYGLLLIIKALLALFLMLLGGINKFVILPAINRRGAGGWEVTAGTRSMMNRVITVEAVVALGVLMSTSIITHLPPQG